MQYLVFALVLLLSSSVLASPKTEANQHVDRATEAHKAGDYATALNELTVAYTLDPRPDLLYAIGQMHVKLGQCGKAITFYERFLATHPEQAAEDRATQAIEVCKTRMARPEPIVDKPTVEKPSGDPPPPPQPTPSPQPPPMPPSPPPPQQSDTTGTSPFYTDLVGDALVLGGVALAVVGALQYRSARHDIELAKSSATYDAHAELVDRAETKRIYTTVFGASGLALIGLGVFRYVRHGKRDANGVAVGPTTGGAVMTWSSRF